MAPQFHGRFGIIERIGLVPYQLALPPTMKFLDVFHAYFHKKYVKDAYHLIDWSVLQVEPDGEFQLESQCIL